MSKTTAKILDDASRLTVKERVELAEAILDGVDGPPDVHHDKARTVEIERRLREIDSGEARMIPWDEAMKRFDDMAST